MNVKDRLGQLIMVGLEGAGLTKRERMFIRKVQPAGVTYFRRNVGSPRQLARLSSDFRSLLSHDTPPLIAIDQEGGKVYRLKHPFTLFPGNDYIARYYQRTRKMDLLRASISAQAAELRAIGVNYNFTPVADIHTNPRNPVIGERRTFGSTSAQVSTLVSETVRAYRREGLISCAKHFPGHGDTFSDSHKSLPVVKTPRATLFRREIVPFRAAIRAGVPTIMTAHVIYSAFDRKRPATLSSCFLKDILRKRLRFRGVCVSDDLEMAAISAHYSLAEAALEAIEAGVDLLLVCKSLDESLSIYERLIRAVDRNEIDSSRIKEALGRVWTLKKEYLRGQGPHIAGRFPMDGWPKHRHVADLVLYHGT